MLTAFVCAAAVLSFAGTASAADIATLSNGSTFRHDHRIVMGEVTRLFLSGGDTNFTDVPTADIVGFEKDLSPPPSTPAPSLPAASFPATAPARPANPAPPVIDLNQVVNSASAAYHLDPDLVNSVIHAESGFNARAVSPKGRAGFDAADAFDCEFTGREQRFRSASKTWAEEAVICANCWSGTTSIW